MSLLKQTKKCLREITMKTFFLSFLVEENFWKYLDPERQKSAPPPPEEEEIDEFASDDDAEGKPIKMFVLSS